MVGHKQREQILKRVASTGKEKDKIIDKLSKELGKVAIGHDKGKFLRKGLTEPQKEALVVAKERVKFISNTAVKLVEADKGSAKPITYVEAKKVAGAEWKKDHPAKYATREEKQKRAHELYIKRKEAKKRERV